MKKVIRASYDDYDINNPKRAYQILAKSKELLDLMEDTTSGYLDKYDLGSLYEELIETIPMLSNELDDGI